MTRGEINGKITIFERTIFEIQKNNKMAGKKSAKSNNNDDKEECGSTKGYEDREDLYAMIQGLTLNMNTFIAKVEK